MARITVNPEAEGSTSFEAVRPGKYLLRIVSVEDRNMSDANKNDLKLRLEHTLANEELEGLDGLPLKGMAQGMFDYIPLAIDKQWKLRQITEAAGLEWTDFDPVIDLVGREVEAVVKTELYNGEQQNKIGRYVK